MLPFFITVDALCSRYTLFFAWIKPYSDPYMRRASGPEEDWFLSYVISSNVDGSKSETPTLTNTSHFRLQVYPSGLKGCVFKITQFYSDGKISRIYPTLGVSNEIRPVSL